MGRRAAWLLGLSLTGTAGFGLGLPGVGSPLSPELVAVLAERGSAAQPTAGVRTGQAEGAVAVKPGARRAAAGATPDAGPYARPDAGRGSDPGALPGSGPDAGPAAPGGGEPGSAPPGPPGAAPPAPAPPGSDQPVPAACGPSALCPAEVEAIALRAAAAVAADDLTVAVVDRLGRPLAVLRKPGATAVNDDRALGLARTAAFFSNSQAPLSSRTIRTISGIHFPPGISNTPNAALYGIENTNRGCDLNVAFLPGREIPPARSLAGELNDERCDAFVRLGCGAGIVTGKTDPFDRDPRAVDPGGVPIFRPRQPFDPGAGPAAREAVLVGGVGVAGGTPDEAEFAAFEGSFGSGSTTPLPQFPLPPPRNVFVDGVRLPFVENLARPAGSAPGRAGGTFVLAPEAGRADPSGYLAGPFAGSRLTATEVDRIVRQAVAAAGRTRAVIRLPRGQRARMAVAVADVDGRLLAIFRMPDSTVFSIDVAATKARNVVHFSASPLAPADLTGVPAGTAVTNRTISFGAQPLYPPGIDGTGGGPFFDLYLFDSANPCSQGAQPANANQSGVVFFPGSIPLYSGGELVGGLGISGDGVEQDDYVAFLGADGFLPPESIRANRVFVRGVRLPFLRFPRNPEE